MQTPMEPDAATEAMLSDDAFEDRALVPIAHDVEDNITILNETHRANKVTGTLAANQPADEQEPDWTGSAGT